MIVKRYLEDNLIDGDQLSLAEINKNEEKSVCINVKLFII